MNTSAQGPNGHTAERKVEEAGARAHETIEQVSDQLHPAVDRLASGAHQAVDKLAGAATHATQTLGARSEQMKEMQQRMMADCRAYVRENPATALAIAAGVGFLLSRLLRGRY